MGEARRHAFNRVVEFVCRAPQPLKTPWTCTFDSVEAFRKASTLRQSHTHMHHHTRSTTPSPRHRAQRFQRLRRRAERACFFDLPEGRDAVVAFEMAAAMVSFERHTGHSVIVETPSASLASS